MAIQAEKATGVARHCWGASLQSGCSSSVPRRIEDLRYLAHDPLVARLCGPARLPTDRTVVNWLTHFTRDALQGSSP